VGVPAPEAQREGVEPSVQELYEDAPCGYLSLLLDGTVVKANRTFLRSTGYPADALLGTRLEDLLTPGSRLYYANHWRPKLDLRGEVREVPADLVRADGSRLTVLINATVALSESGRPTAIRASLFDATDRRRYERELLSARDIEHAARSRAERLQRVSAALSDAVTPADVAVAVLRELGDYLDADQSELWANGIQIGHLAGDRTPISAVADTLQLCLRVGEREVGELRFDFGKPHTSTPEEATFLSTCTAQCAQALARAQLFAEASERAEQQAALAALGTSALEDVVLARLIQEAAQVVLTMLRADSVTVTQPGDVVDVRRGDPNDVEPASTLRIAIGSSPDALGELLVRADPTRRFTAADADFAAGVAQVLGNAVERCRNEEVAKHQATHDPLTALPNRLLFSERLEHEILRARRSQTYFAMCVVDLDDFKLINDTLGHLGGDGLLCAVGERLVAVMRDVDMVARLGGDEFVILAADLAHPDDGEMLAQRVADALREPFHQGSSEHVVRASVGIVLGGPDSTPEGVLRDANVAMYHAKDSGRGRHALFDVSMHEDLQRRLETENELRVALRDGDLRVFYQPVVNGTTRRVLGMEALVRWEHPLRGLISPAEFIPVAEATGLIVDLGRHVMREACRQLVQWRDERLIDDDVTVAVNFSGRQLVHTGFVDEVAGVLAETGLDKTPALLGLEITETALMQSTDAAAEVLAGLAGLGVRLLLDDFGTGASSLARLKRFPVDTLKIDGAFIRGIGTDDHEDDAIVAAIIAMANALGLRVIAECVETETQLAVMLKLGCESIQGYLFSRPLPAHEMQQLLAQTLSCGHRRHGVRVGLGDGALGRGR
jgi:diguanylate cyclase (GGDEF)-like protein/PAS domain S-box-containing protein